MPGTTYSLEVRPLVPPQLARQPEPAANLLYSWDRDLRGLFRLLDTTLYDQCGANLRVCLRRVAQERLDRAALDATYIEAYSRVTSAYDAYHAKGMPASLRGHLDPERDLVAYFCLEFGVHESLPLYSGGLGILAGDHCKAASDLGIPFVGVGLLYHNGYFTQTIDGHGNQISQIVPSDFRDMPIQPVSVGGERLCIELQPRMLVVTWRGR